MEEIEDKRQQRLLPGQFTMSCALTKAFEGLVEDFIKAPRKMDEELGYAVGVRSVRAVAAGSEQDFETS